MVILYVFLFLVTLEFILIIVIVRTRATSGLHLRVRRRRSLPPELIVRLQAVGDDLVEGPDEAVEALHLLGHVLIVLKGLVVLPTGRDGVNFVQEMGKLF